jgi:hypothetical protein
MHGPTRTPVTESEDARVHCAVLNVRPVTPCPPPPATHLPQEHAGTRAKEPCQRSRHRPVPRTGPLPQDPTACLRTDLPRHHVPNPEGSY